ncbi:MAG: ABC transporter ATP-binding protein [Bacilli bacterium]|nr:ABC transporter ATP-binding protein [Bacilli bacterium]
MNKILEIKNLSKKYHTKKGEIEAVKDFSIDIYEDDFVAIVGPSGCGKSTILSILSNLDKKTNGEIINHQKNIGYMLQSDALFDWLTVLDNCLLGLKIQKKLTKENKEYVINLINKYGLKDFINSYPSSLSGGMRQRVALIRTLATKPDIMLLDEPFSALDYQTRLSISNDIYTILKQEKKSIILVTHDIAEAISLCNKVIVLSKRPSIIKNVYQIDLDKNIKPTKRRHEDKFNYYYDLIWKDIDYDN